jgi:hypothetical protein
MEHSTEVQHSGLEQGLPIFAQTGNISIKIKTFNGTHLQKFVKEFEQSGPTSLERMGDSLIEVIKHGSKERVLRNEQFGELSEKYK